MLRSTLIILLVLALIPGCSRSSFSPPDTLPGKAETMAPLDWGVILYGIRACEEDPSLAITDKQAKKLLPMVNLLIEISRSSNGLKRAINGILTQEQVEYLLDLAARDMLEKDEFLNDLRKFPPETALIDLVRSRLEPIVKEVHTPPGEPGSFPQHKKEIHVVSDLLVGILKIKDLSPEQAYLIKKYLDRFRPLLSREAKITSKMEDVLTPEQHEYIVKNRERFTLMTDELPVEPVEEEDILLSQAETPFLKSIKSFLEARIKR
ncbi:MAG: hypothetical protein J7M18_02625 [Candidatus Eremiobacteraeota bacterium]|nr:hypothetical protein [Candidatus Eremiobacteraeota bacterium]